MVDKLITDFISFDSIVDSLDEFHKTEAYSTKFLFYSIVNKEKKLKNWVKRIKKCQIKLSPRLKNLVYLWCFIFINRSFATWIRISGR